MLAARASRRNSRLRPVPKLMDKAAGRGDRLDGEAVFDAAGSLGLMLLVRADGSVHRCAGRYSLQLRGAAGAA